MTKWQDVRPGDLICVMNARWDLVVSVTPDLYIDNLLHIQTVRLWSQGSETATEIILGYRDLPEHFEHFPLSSKHGA